MAINTSPVFTRVPRSAVLTLAAANTARDGSGTIPTLLVGAADGTRIDEIRFTSAQASVGASAANVMRVWLSIDATAGAGVTWYLLAELAEATVTSSNTVIGAQTIFPFPSGLFLKDATYAIGVTMSIRATATDDHDVIALGGDLTA